jgi:small subunit ribosomal protein S8
MTMTDPIADMLTRIRNTILARRRIVDIPASRIKVDIAKVLKEEGYIKNFKIVEGTPQATLKLSLKYDQDGESVIVGLKRISRPGRRIYVQRDAIRPVLGGLGISIVTTSQGLKTGKKCVAEGLGGEVICHIW